MKEKQQKKHSMWKHVVVLMGLFVTGSTISYASEVPDPIPLTVGIDDPVPASPGHGKGSVTVPTVIQDDYELTFLSSHPAYTLYILEDDVVVYSVVVSSSTTTVILPSWLSGEYELQLHPDGCGYFFYGYIEL